MEEIQSALFSNASQKNQEVDRKDMTILALSNQNNRGRGVEKGSTNNKGIFKYNERYKQCFNFKEWGHNRPNCPLKRDPDESLVVVTLDYADVCTIFN